MKLFGKFILIPATLLGLLVPVAVKAGGGDHSSHHGHQDGDGQSGEASPSSMIMGKTFVIGGVDGVSSNDGTTLLKKMVQM